MTKQIQLTQGKVALVSDHRYDDLVQWKWQALKSRKKDKWYAVCKVGNKIVSMHRQIMNAPDGVLVDHRDNDGLNNQDENLRLCTRPQNAHNREINRNTTTGFKGVSWHKYNKSYRAQIRVNGTKKTLGYFADPVDAAHKYDQAARQYFGEFAQTNF